MSGRNARLVRQLAAKVRRSSPDTRARDFKRWWRSLSARDKAARRATVAALPLIASEPIPKPIVLRGLLDWIPPSDSHAEFFGAMDAEFTGRMAVLNAQIKKLLSQSTVWVVE